MNVRVPIAGSDAMASVPADVGEFERLEVDQPPHLLQRRPGDRGGSARQLRFYRIALVVSVVLNGLLFAALWLYSSIESFLSLIGEAVGYLG